MNNALYSLNMGGNSVSGSSSSTGNGSGPIGVLEFTGLPMTADEWTDLQGIILFVCPQLFTTYPRGCP
jgi:hypothetical protein